MCNYNHLQIFLFFYYCKFFICEDSDCKEDKISEDEEEEDENLKMKDLKENKWSNFASGSSQRVVGLRKPKKKVAKVIIISSI